MYSPQSLVPPSMMTYPPPLYHRPQFSLSPSAGPNGANGPQNYYTHHPGHPGHHPHHPMYGTYDVLHNYVPSDPCKQALMMASQAAGFAGMGGEYNTAFGKLKSRLVATCVIIIP